AAGPAAGGGPAAGELRRVRAAGGSVLLSVPFGEPDDFGWLRVFSAAELERLIEAFGPAEVRTTYFAYDAGGWQVADAQAAAALRYRDPFSQPLGEDRAPAARAVACVELRTS